MYQKRYVQKEKPLGPVVDEKRIYNYAVKLLTGRDYSEVKLKEKLRLKNFDKTVVEKVVAEIKERGFLREESYLEARIKAFMNKGYAKKYILQKLTRESD
ncbi:MAG: RecX family transcriptional regulator, partial [Bacteriovoracaceae bacterium]|nr:RecX family transcriptional regulator [Bacteriovoracaceae bacterium]